MEVSDLIARTKNSIATILEVVNRAWRLAFQIQVSCLNNNTFMFHFQHKVDMANAYRRRPWSIRGGHLVLKQWLLALTWQEIPFITSTMWVQVHGLPELWKSLDNLRKLGEKAEKSSR
ncbi:hypothetical protein CFP56_012078 [Quercus suber]|uniref:DUF4283 domain-containing protein n=1 Tax=Quercus suber TaxID=58331 RepID=A0AAW0L000_QUESU